MLGITAHRLTLCKPNARNRKDTFGGCQMDNCHQSFAKKLVGYHLWLYSAPHSNLWGRFLLEAA